MACMALSSCNNLATKPNYDSDEVNAILTSQRRAETAYTNEDWEQAIKYYKELLDQHPEDSVAWYRLANSYSAVSQNDQAIMCYEKSVELEPANTKAWHNLGVLQLKLATQTFIKMQDHASETDEYAKRGRYVVNSIGEILQQGFGIQISHDNASKK